jgi:hypothetical protein
MTGSLASQLGGIIVVILVLGFVTLFAWALITQRNKVAARKQRLIAMGFSAVASPDPELAGRILALHQMGFNRRLELRNVFQKPLADGQVYLFDLWDAASSESATLHTGVIGIVSPLLNLPCFVVMPFPELGQKTPGFLANAAEKLLNWAAGRAGWTHFEFPENPAFDQRHFVAGQDEAAVRLFLSDYRLAQLLSLERSYQIDAGGNAFTLVRLSSSDAVLSKPEDFETLLADARRVFNWFQ